MGAILIILILLVGSIHLFFRKNTRKTPLISLGISAILSLYFFIDSLGGKSSEAFFYGMILFFLVIGFLIIWSSFSMIDYDIDKDTYPAYYAMAVILIASLCGIVYFDNLIVIYVFLELSAFLSAGLVMIKPSRINYRAGVKYLLLSILASAFFLIGIVILYRLTNTIRISEIRDLLYINNDIGLIKYSFIFIFIGIGFKSALFPFHIWLPDAYGSAPASSSAILSGIVSKSYIVLFIKLIYLGFGIDLIKETDILSVILILGVCGMIYGSFLAILQEDLQHRIAYSSVAQIGYIFMGIGLGNTLGLIAATLHIIGHGISKSCLFLTEGTIVRKTGLRKTGDMDGIGKILPVTMAMYTICSLSMVGIPLFVGFISKWNFAIAIMDQNKIFLVFILSLSSLLNGLYFLPLAIKAFFSIDKSNKELRKFDFKKQAPVLILGLLVVFTGIFSSPLIELINHVIERLI